MDSGGILCLHYPFCCHSALVPGLCDAADVYPLGPAGWGRREDEMAPPLGADRGDVARAVAGGDGLGGCELPDASRL